MAHVDADALETRVKDMYRRVAEHPDGDYHFEMGRGLAERLGYPAELLDVIPAGAVESFAGVGYFLDLADLKAGERVLDLGSGSGMDSFAAATLVTAGGRVVGVDFTAEQLAKARHLAALADLKHVEFLEGRIESAPVGDAGFDCVVSNGVVNLAPDKARVFAEAARVLRPGGRLAMADIVSERQLADSIVTNPDLWASCIGGAAQQDGYRQMITDAGLRVEHVRTNAYAFLTEQARDASAGYGVRSISVLAIKPSG
jgi:arsenite methyltransferase